MFEASEDFWFLVSGDESDSVKVWGGRDGRHLKSLSASLVLPTDLNAFLLQVWQNGRNGRMIPRKFSSWRMMVSSTLLTPASWISLLLDCLEN